ncbi:D-glycero-beta-D-manno-heptose 1,7-bisphosphate 7-phosphatase [soil metagenome]
MNKCVFLDRDGVLNVDNPEYTYEVGKFEIIAGVPEALKTLKASGFLLIVVTNQSGIAKGIYTADQMQACHQYMQENCAHAIDWFYFSPYHRTVTNSLMTKPGTLMFEKAIAKYKIDINASWMIGDRGRDIVPARQLGIKTIQIGDEVDKAELADFKVESLLEAAQLIVHSARK